MSRSADRVTPDENSMARRAHVVWIDNETETRDVIAKQLLAQGMRVSCFHDGPQALDGLQKMKPRPDFVLLELAMPAMSGLEILRFMRKSERLRDVPAVIISAHRQEQLIKTCVQLGIKDFLLKPIASELLQQRLECLVVDCSSNQARVLLSQCQAEAPDLLENSVFRRFRNKGLRAHLVAFGSEKLVLLVDASFTRDQLMMLDEELLSRHLKIFLPGAPWMPIWPRGPVSPPPQPVAEAELRRSLGNDLLDLVNECAGGQPRSQREVAE